MVPDRGLEVEEVERVELRCSFEKRREGTRRVEILRGEAVFL